MHQDNQERLVGLLAVDGPNPADEAWLRNIEETFGECQLVPMTRSGTRGLACQMEIEPSSVHHLRSVRSMGSTAIQASLRPFLDRPPAPTLRLRWDEQRHIWASEFEIVEELPIEIAGYLSGSDTVARQVASIHKRVQLKAHIGSRTGIVPRRQEARRTRQAS